MSNLATCCCCGCVVDLDDPKIICGCEFDRKMGSAALFAIHVQSGRVVIDFRLPVKSLNLQLREARDIGEALVKLADYQSQFAELARLLP